ncbi:Ig-like domain-containing protein [Flammeovirga sp. SubArs3]|uniref:Ig-like domain-containing protein n=1 Tax=Flammeovirga sp. SubArs3 TaxID=2995316 RepID=UPI00248AD414|nr:Ig-like domain-containing protein [Flammeovirga sp. SubArs3]
MNFTKLSLLFSSLIVLFSACNKEVLPEVESSQTESSSARTLAAGEVVAIANPLNGSNVILGSTISVETITDTNVDLIACRLWIDDVFHSVVKTAPYNFDVSGLALGTHTLMVRANGADGVNHDSEIISITVVDGNLPGSVEITSLSNGDTFTEGEDILITSASSDGDGVKNMRLWIDNTYIDLDQEAPFQFTVNNLTPGSHTIVLKMKDQKDNVTSSAPVTIEVEAAQSQDIVWDDFSLNILPYTRMSGYQDIIFNNSVVGTTEFLILSASHGNPDPGQYQKESKVEGGDWTKIGYGGDDDKSAEVWVRQVTSSNKDDHGQINTKNAAAKLTILSYDGLISTGATQDLYFFNKKASIDHKGAKGPFLVVIATDNGKESTMSDLNYGYNSNGTAGDDMTMLYLTHDDQFYDNTFTVRGGAVSIQLLP